jgi:hypothetical protein
MGFRFSKRLTIMPGVHLNLGLGGPSLSVGPRGASVNIGRKGVFGNVGIPGSGLSYRHKLSGGARRTPGLPDLPEDLVMEIEDGRVEFAMPDGRRLDDDDRARAVREHRTEAERLLQAHVDQVNEGRTVLTRLHLDTPRAYPATPSSTAFAVPKPQRSGYVDQDGYMTALMGWRAAQANHESGSSASFDPSELERALSALSWPRQTDISYDHTADGGIVALDVDLPEIEDMPSQEYEAATRSLSVRTVDLSAKRLADLYSSHVASIVFRLAGETFAASPAREVRISGYTQRTGGTGRIDDEYVVSVVVDRTRWCTIDFDRLGDIDPENALARFGMRLERTGRGALRTVAPCQPL